MLEKKAKRIDYKDLKDGDIFWSETTQCLVKLIFYDDFIGYYCKKMHKSEGIILKGETPIYECPSLIKVLL